MSRRYSETELRAILAKAIEDGDSGPSGGTGDLSLEQIKEIGAEVGIDPASLERAARSIASPRGGPGTLWAGAPTVLDAERRVEGALDDAPKNEILSTIRRAMGTPGDLSELQDLLEWRSSGELGQRVITLSSTDGSTTVSGMADLNQGAVITHFVAGLLGFIGSLVGFMISANNGNEIGMVLFAALLPAVLLVTRRFFARFSRSEQERLDRVVEELALLIRDSGNP